MTQNLRLQVELLKQNGSKSVLAESLRIVRFKLLKTVCDLIWDAHLLQVAIFEIRVPLTTLHCLSRKYIPRSHHGYALISNMKVKMLRAASMKKISNHVYLSLTYLFEGLKEVSGALFCSRSQYGIEKPLDESIYRFLSPEENIG